MPKIHKTHPIQQSRFYGMKSRKKLAELLYTNVKTLEKIANAENMYDCWEKEKSDGRTRLIEAPKGSLKSKQSRIALLLGRIEKPSYLMAPVKGRSYVSNAAAHIGSQSFRLMDVENFFPSCSAKKVFWFFNKKLLCSMDVAAILTKLSTFNNRLPQGSPASPILAYYAYLDMWDEIDLVVRNAGYIWTLYADDITISADVVYEKDVWEIKRILKKHGHNYHRGKLRSVTASAVKITGVIVHKNSLLLPNCKHLEKKNLMKKFSIEKGQKERRKMANQIRGREVQARQVLNYLENQV